MSAYRHIEYDDFFASERPHCCYLLSEGIPPSSELTMVESHWYASDIPQSTKEFNGNTSYGETDIVYRFNSLGYRCPEPTVAADIKVLTIGCSHTFGVGIRAEERFSHVFADKLRTDTGRSVVDWNLAFPGKSQDYVARMLHACVPVLDPDIVLILFPDLARREYAAAGGRTVDFLPHYPAFNRLDTAPYETWTRLISDFNDRIRFFTNYSGIKRLLRGRELLYAFLYYRQGADALSDHIDDSCWVHWMWTPERDVARDGCHLGPQAHASLADAFWERFVESGSRGRVLDRHRAPAADVDAAN